jgi:hypothetical protein
MKGAISLDRPGRVTSGLNLTENRRFEFAVAAAAGAVD